MKRLLGLALVLIMVLAGISTALGAGFTIDERGYPVLNEGEKATIKVAIAYNSAYDGLPDDLWYWKWVEKMTGIDFEFEAIENASRQERLNLMFTSNELPDLVMCFGMSPADLMRYGALEGQLYDWKDMIDKMPNLKSFFDMYDDVLPQITAPDGALYALPTFTIADRVGGLRRLFVNMEWLKEAGYESAPETLDDFTEMLRKFKANHPESTPLGGGADAVDPRSYIMNAVGFLTNNNDGIDPELLDGEVVIPAGHKLFKEYLATMKTYYDEGLISPEFFTLDNTAAGAAMAEGNVGVFSQPAYLYLKSEEEYGKFWAVKPLTSATNDTQAWRDANVFPIGNLVATKAAADKIELLAAYLDFCYSPLYTVYGWDGPQKGPDTLDMEDVPGWVYNVEREVAELPQEVIEKYRNGYLYIRKVLSSVGNGYVGAQSGAIMDGVYRSRAEIYQDMAGLEMVKKPHDPKANGDEHYRASVEQNLLPYVGVKPQYPTYSFFNDEDSVEISDLKTVLLGHVKSETAKFITGARDLAEFDNYLSELESMGLSKYLGHYADYYAAIKAK